METNKSYIEQAKKNVSELMLNRRDFRRISTFRGNDFYQFYAATNENLEYFADLGVAGKDTLTVTGSGDHALNLAYFGAKSIETFDINELAFIAQDLKITALMHLSRSEFIDFYSSPDFFDRKLYKKIYPQLSELTKAVFDTIFKHIHREKNFENLIAEFDLTEKNLVLNNPYLSSERAYLETCRRVKNLAKPIQDKFCPAHKLNEVFEPKDIIILSNILKYYMNGSYLLNNEFNFSNKEKVQDFVKALKSTLTDDGLVSLICFYFKNDYEFIARGGDEYLKQYFKIKGACKVMADKIYPKNNYIFLAKKEDFPEFEK